MRSYLHSGQCHNPTNSTNYYLSQGHGVGEAPDHAEASEATPVLLRRSSAAAAAADPAPLLFSAPRLQTPPSAAPLGRTPGAPGIFAAPAPGGGRAGVLYVTERSGEKKGAHGSCRRQPLPLPPRGDAVPQAARQQEMGGKSAAGACGSRTIPVRQRAALPRFARRELRAVSTALPPRLRDVPPAPLPAPRWGLGGGWGPRAPRSRHTRAGPALRSVERPGRFLQRRTAAPAPRPENPGTARKSPGHPLLSTLRGNPVPLCRRREENKQKPRKTETGPGCGMGGSGESPAPTDTRPVSRSAAPVSRSNHRDHLRRLARYSPPRDRPARPHPPAPPSYIRDRSGVPFPALAKFDVSLEISPQRGNPDSTSPKC